MGGGRDNSDDPPLLRRIVFWVFVALLCAPVTGLIGVGLGAQLAGYKSYYIPAASMKPTLRVGDHLFAAPYRDPAEIRRGDIVIFTSPIDPNIVYVKRVLGLPGDRVQLRKGLLYLNRARVQTRRVDDFVEPRRIGNQICMPHVSTRERCVKERFVETLPNGMEHEILNANSNRRGADNTKEFAVPQNHLFVLGDNRDNSRDSRVELGFVPVDNVLYRNGFIWYSSLENLSRWLSAIAPDEPADRSEVADQAED